MMKNIKTFQETKERLKKNAGAGLNKVVCVVLVLVLIVLVCVGGFYWYKHNKNKELNPLEQSGGKIESGEIGGNLSSNELMSMGLQLGDYVKYKAGDTYIDWRVWKIEEDNVIIVPTVPLGNLTLEGQEDWLNAEEKIENECDKYINNDLGITAENIRSMKIEDIEEVLPEEEVTQSKQKYNYGKEYSYESGTFYAEKAEADTFDGYNEELSTPKTASSSSPVKVKHTNWYDDSPMWNKLNNTKMIGDTYGTILGDSYGWLSSCCVDCDTSGAYIAVHMVNSGRVSSDGWYYLNEYGVRPLVSLDSKLFNGAGGGTLSNPWQLGEKIESEEGTNGSIGRNLSGNELVEMDLLQIGDYVSYTTSIGTNADWRVWKIEEDNVIIVPTAPLGDLTLEGAEDWLNAEEKIENECDKYINESLGITIKDIRSMKIEDIEEVLPKEAVDEVKEKYDYGKEKYNYESGIFYAEKAEADTFDGYNKELNTPKSASLNNPVKLVNTLWGSNTGDQSWNKLKNTKMGMNNSTYGNILGYKAGWLASRCVDCIPNDAYFYVGYVTNSHVGFQGLYGSDSVTDGWNHGVRPLVTISSTLFNGAGEGTENNPWQLREKL